MKRSEAIEKLKSVLEEWDGCLIDKKAATEILTKIEKEIGMIPPKTDWMVKNEPDKMRWEELHDYHFWEPEKKK